VEVLGIGNVPITPISFINRGTRLFTLRDVLYAPQIGVNLVSVGALTNDESHVHFYDSEAFISRRGILIMTAKRVQEAIYQLNLALSTDVAMLAHSSFEISLRDWHERFAHQNSELIVKLGDSKKVIGPSRDREPLEKSHDSIIAKMTRKVFPHSISQQSLWSSATYAAQCKLDWQPGRHFLNRRRNRVPKYCSIWLKRKGITHQTTCQYTPQQNAIERDNRTIVSHSVEPVYYPTRVSLSASGQRQQVA
jgi:hypothetical protein